MPIIEVKNAALTYRVIKNRTGSIKELFKDALKGRIHLIDYPALTDVSFSVNKGEVLAILGKNGAGKSTLLKILAGVLPVTKGTCKVNGSIAPMIELGAGFHPEMTGSENVLFYSALMGRHVKTVKGRMTAIGEWAEVTDHMDFPLRAFSSGMVARLAFSTATDQKSDVLLIDEVLSVGDADFQKKSRARISELISQGVAVILVSHDLHVVREIADRVLWLEKGKVRMIGNASDVVDAYEAN